MKKTLLIVSLLVLSTACQCTNAKNNGSYSAPADAKEDDETINKRVQDALYNDPSMSASTRNVHVKTQDHIVILTGNVATKEDANRIIRKVKGIKGVHHVNNQLMVGQLSHGQQGQ